MPPKTGGKTEIPGGLRPRHSACHSMWTLTVQNNSGVLFYFVFSAVLGQGLEFPRQGLCHLSHGPGPSFLSSFYKEELNNLCPRSQVMGSPLGL
jgi:hypothetical protein